MSLSPLLHPRTLHARFFPPGLPVSALRRIAPQTGVPSSCQSSGQRLYDHWVCRCTALPHTTLRLMACVNDFTSCSRQRCTLHSLMVTGWTVYLGLCSGCVRLIRRASALRLLSWFLVSHSASLGNFYLGTPLLNPVRPFILFCPTTLGFQAPFTTVFRGCSCLRSSCRLVLFLYDMMPTARPFNPHTMAHLGFLRRVLRVLRWTWVGVGSVSHLIGLNRRTGWRTKWRPGSPSGSPSFQDPGSVLPGSAFCFSAGIGLCFSCFFG